ncbi:MAG: hypothetical protein PUP91_32695 [Rhizonema sp. PD37]|nr:hypothetical protein [Rhizonema sp. PD37]
MPSPILTGIPLPSLRQGWDEHSCTQRTTEIQNRHAQTMISRRKREKMGQACFADLFGCHTN